ncbi:MAG: right-handed parallel beta-helix repeat-containing protein [Bryobacterales bacterium]|nr:right-handed parallel beta-helix repeat-containing protein [Bryobacterales bacterium]
MQKSSSDRHGRGWRRIGFVGLGLVLALAPGAFAGRYDFTTIDYPGAVSTIMTSINDAGDMVGRYVAPDRKTRGFVLKNGEFTIVELPEAAMTVVTAITKTGDIGGYYTEASGLEHGFILSGGRFTTIPDYPGFEMTRALGLNAKGEMVGMIYNRAGDTRYRGFVWSGGQFIMIDYPESNLMTCLFKINDESDAAGHWQDTTGIIHGLLWSKGKLTSFDVPGASQTMIDVGKIIPAGDIAGPYRDLRGKTKGFLLSKGAVTRLDMPGAQQTFVRDMNNLGNLVGNYIDAGGVSHGLLMRPAPAVPQVLTVDDDGADCPGALRTIQEAVERAPAGATILVCPGTYRHTVQIKGHSKDGLKLIAAAQSGEVVLEGDYTEPNGFLLEDVDNVLLRGFTVKDFGNKPTTAEQWGAGNNILLRNAHHNTIEDNTVVDGDMVGIQLADSGNNTVRNNSAYVTNPELANCGIHVGGRNSKYNFIGQNLIQGNQMAGIMISGAGADNIVTGNTVLSNGRYGITNQDSEATRIEGNRVSYSRGVWGKTPFGQQPGIGIDVQNSNKVTVFDNRARNNSGVDLNWDGKGENKLDANACDKSTPAGACAR